MTAGLPIEGRTTVSRGQPPEAVDQEPEKGSKLFPPCPLGEAGPRQRAGHTT
jgi:hypothetical protein